MVTVWQQLILVFIDDTVFTLTDAGIKDYNGRKLFSTTSTTVTCDEQSSSFPIMNWGEIKEKFTDAVHPLTQPKVQNVISYKYPTCNN